MANHDPVLVTGGSGYIASFIIAQLLEAGHPVRATVRHADKAPQATAAIAKLTPLADRIEWFAATLDADHGWAEAVAGCGQVYHVASPLPLANPKDDDVLVRPARDGALRVLKAARDAGVARVVMTSSTAAIAYGHGSRAVPFTEDDWSSAADRSDSSAYERSKLIAEQAAWAWHSSEGMALELVTVCPGAVLGPVLGADFSASIDIVRKLLDGSVPGLPRFGWPLVDVRDIAALHILAMNAPQAAGRRYLGAGAFFWMRDIADVLRTRVPEVARKVPRMGLPDWLVRLSSRFDPVIRERLFELGKHRPVSNARAIDELGWAPRDSAQTIEDTARSLIEQGLVKPR